MSAGHQGGDVYRKLATALVPSTSNPATLPQAIWMIYFSLNQMHTFLPPSPLFIPHTLYCIHPYPKGKGINRNKEDHFLIIKRSIYQEDIISLNIYMPNNRNKYMKQKLIEPQWEIDTVIIRNVNIQLSIHKTRRQKINKDIKDLTITINSLDLIDIYRTFHSTTTGYTSF